MGEYSKSNDPSANNFKITRIQSLGLFHKAIYQSGTATCPWAIGLSTPENCFKLASILGFEDSKDPKEVVEFLRTIPASQLIEAQFKILTLSVCFERAVS